MSKLKNLSIVAIAVVAAGLFTYFLIRFIQYKEMTKIVDETKNIARIESEEKIKLELKRKVFSEQPKIVKKIPVLSEDAGSEIKKLIEMLKNDDFQISQEAANKLVNMGHKAVSQLIEALQGASAALKGQLVFILGRIGDKQAVPVLIQLLEDENAYIRGNAAEALGKIKDERAVYPLITSLFNSDNGVRERSAWALGELNNSEAVERLIDRLSDEKDERVKTAVINSLGKIKDRRATSALLTELKSKNDQLFKNEVMLVLGEVGDPAAIKDISDCLNASKRQLDTLKKEEPKEQVKKMFNSTIIFQIEQTIKIAQEAMKKIQKN